MGMEMERSSGHMGWVRAGWCLKGLGSASLQDSVAPTSRARTSTQSMKWAGGAAPKQRREWQGLRQPETLSAECGGVAERPGTIVDPPPDLALSMVSSSCDKARLRALRKPPWDEETRVERWELGQCGRGWTT